MKNFSIYIILSIFLSIPSFANELVDKNVQVIQLSQLVERTITGLSSMSENVTTVQTVLEKKDLNEKNKKEICKDLNLLEQKSNFLIELNLLNDLFLQFGTDEKLHTLPQAQEFDEFFKPHNINDFIALGNETLIATGYCEGNENGHYISLDFQWYRLLVEPSNNKELEASVRYMNEIIERLKTDLEPLKKSDSFIELQSMEDTDLEVENKRRSI